MPGFSKQPLQRDTLSDAVLVEIKELLLAGQLKPGESVSLRKTAEKLGVSMMPVRTAIYQLVADRALEVAPNRSARVPVMTAEQFNEVTRIRLQVESYAVEQATAHASPELVAQLRKINDELADRMTGGNEDLRQAILLNKALHFHLYKASRMPMLVNIIESLWLRIGPVLNYDISSSSERTRDRIAAGHHARMIDAVEARDPPSASAALRDDIGTAYQYIIATQYSGNDLAADLCGSRG